MVWMWIVQRSKITGKKQHTVLDVHLGHPKVHSDFCAPSYDCFDPLAFSMPIWPEHFIIESLNYRLIGTLFRYFISSEHNCVHLKYIVQE